MSARWLTQPGVWLGIALVCAVLTLFVDKPVHFGFDGVPGFYLGLVLVANALLIVAARLLGPLLRRREDA